MVPPPDLRARPLPRLWGEDPPRYPRGDRGGGMGGGEVLREGRRRRLGLSGDAGGRSPSAPRFARELARLKLRESWCKKGDRGIVAGLDYLALSTSPIVRLNQ